MKLTSSTVCSEYGAYAELNDMKISEMTAFTSGKAELLCEASRIFVCSIQAFKKSVEYQLTRNYADFRE
jgi:hypothetical protein